MAGNEPTELLTCDEIAVQIMVPGTRTVAEKNRCTKMVRTLIFDARVPGCLLAEPGYEATTDDPAYTPLRATPKGPGRWTADVEFDRGVETVTLVSRHAGDTTYLVALLRLAGTIDAFDLAASIDRALWEASDGEQGNP